MIKRLNVDIISFLELKVLIMLEIFMEKMWVILNVIMDKVFFLKDFVIVKFIL